MKRSFFVILAVTAMLGGCAAARNTRIERDPFFESFYEKARLIMTREEVQIYKHLPDAQARNEFIDEFWKKRDPFPETENNEYKIEFERRIAYANRWFKENRPAGRGWDSPRGRILIQLGEPDNRYLKEMINEPSIKGFERWIYYQYQLELIFVDSDGFGEFKLRNWPAQLLTALNWAKYSLSLNDRKSSKESFTFESAYRDGEIVIAIPMKKIRFREVGDNIEANYRISVYVYRQYRKIDEPIFTKRLSYPKEGLPDEKTVEFSLPYPLKEKGKYYMDIVMEDVLSASKSRNFIDFKQ